MNPEAFPVEESSNVLRDKTAMVLRALEQALGRLLRESLIGPSRPVSTDHVEMVSDDDHRTVEGIIERAYLDDLLTRLARARQNTPDEIALTRLRELLTALSIFDIRNAVAHPNRPFFPHFWYRIVAIASDPVIGQLSLDEVSLALSQAFLGRISPPPDEWLRAPIWRLPNNLPATLEHDSTGLIGRNRELQEFLQLLRSPRFGLVAVISPGGLGKTALLLEGLRTLTGSPDSLAFIDRIFYGTAKLEALTADGLIQLQSSHSTLQRLEQALACWLLDEPDPTAASFAAALDEHGETRLLLAIDNLETFLRDAPEDFRSFYRRVPQTWRLVVTSRIPLQGAEPLTLKPLPKGGATTLAADYLKRHGVKPPSTEFLEHLAAKCDYNPLGIKLAVDAYARGADLQDVLASTHTHVIEFAYRSLLETLSITEREVLESLYLAEDVVDREYLRSILDTSIDETARALNALVETTLVSRVSRIPSDGYLLTSAARDLLLLYPMPPATHSKIVDRLRRLRAMHGELRIRQHHSAVSPLDWKHVGDDLSGSHSLLAHEALKLLGTLPESRERVSGARRHRLVDLAARLRAALETAGPHGTLQRQLGLIYLVLGDQVRGRQTLRLAASTPFDPAAALLLSREYRDSDDLDAAAEVASKLMDEGWGDPDNSNPADAAEVIKAYWLPRIWLDKAIEAISGTKDWRNRGPLRSTFASLHANAWRKLAQYADQPAEFEPALLTACAVIDEQIRVEGYGGYLVVEGLRLLENIAYKERTYGTWSSLALERFTSFAHTHLRSLCAASDEYTLHGEEVTRWLFELMSLPISPNPLHDESWWNVIGRVSLDPLSIPLTFLKRPQTTFLFAADRAGRSYYIHRNQFRCGQRFWNALSVGSELVAVPAAEIPGRATPVERAAIPGW